MVLEFKTQESLMEFVMEILEWSHPDATVSTNIVGCVLEVQVSGKAAVALKENLEKLFSRVHG